MSLLLLGGGGLLSSKHLEELQGMFAGGSEVLQVEVAGCPRLKAPSRLTGSSVLSWGSVGGLAEAHFTGEEVSAVPLAQQGLW